VWFAWWALEILIQRKENKQSSAEFLLIAKYEVALWKYYHILEFGLQISSETLWARWTSHYEYSTFHTPGIRGIAWINSKNGSRIRSKSIRNHEKNSE